MPAAILDLNGVYIIEQGSSWSLEILLDGDVTGAFIRGQIKQDYGEESIAEFRLNVPVFDDDNNQTRFRLFLNAGVTAQMPLPPANGFWIYDLLLYVPEQEPRRLLRGKVFVSPGVTNVSNRD